MRDTGYQMKESAGKDRKKMEMTNQDLHVSLDSEEQPEDNVFGTQLYESNRSQREPSDGAIAADDHLAEK